MKIKLDPSIALAFLTCSAQPAASPAQALSHLAFIQRVRALIREDERIGAGQVTFTDALVPSAR